ncbi:tyrosine-type recombinase/integrase [Moraxella pluranimalium]|uniref:Integrase n=1 Tax=Moraxella pluranimalium TaxID=470453 RepID=A0A1T0CS38_9GAMM|nr:site-specific integrase [Moraxella pluranimalium]OOS25156.1 integrase [Moraxella pluranimalium]
MSLKNIPKIHKVGNKYRIQTMINGKRYSATRATQEECINWFNLLCNDLAVNQKEEAILCLLEVIELYRKRVLSRLKSGDRATSIISLLVKEHPDLVTTPITDITPKHLTAWKDRRLLQVSEGTVLLEMSFLRCVFEFAINELYLLEVNPMSRVKRPSKPPPRDRRITPEEEAKVLQWTRYKVGEPPDTCRKQVGWCFLFALQTAMRRGEILALTAEHIHTNHVHIPHSKNGLSRDVVLNSAAKEMLKDIKPLKDRLFPIRLDNFNLIWRRMQQQLWIKDLHFHDTRHEAISRMVRDLNIPVEKLAKITGHKDIKTLINVYYNPTVDELIQYFS